MISRVLSERGQGHFGELIDKAQGKIGVVVSFVAVLELIKRGLVGFGDEVAADGFELSEQTLYWLA